MSREIGDKDVVTWAVATAREALLGTVPEPQAGYMVGNADFIQAVAILAAAIIEAGMCPPN